MYNNVDRLHVSIRFVFRAGFVLISHLYVQRVAR